MALRGGEIQRRLAPFAARWSVYEGGEREEAQTFLNELLGCYGTERSEVARFEAPQAGGFVDMSWPRVCIVEMKAPAEAKRLARHREQALGYWMQAADAERGVPAPRFVVICAFRRLEVWEPGAFPTEPRAVLDLIELPERYDTLLFLAGREPVFVGDQQDVTREAVAQVTELYRRLGDRIAAGPDVLRDLALQVVWCMFAEDLGLLDAHLFTRLVDELRDDPSRSAADDLGQLFAWLNDPTPQRPRHGRYAGVPYADGGLFAEPARVHLEPDELDLLRGACRFDWRRVQPAIFGSLLEGCLGHDKQWALGAHYTHEADIQKVVQPTVVRPWRERIENVATHAEAVAAQNDLMRYVVLDPACGSGNFLYVAYRELRRLEARLREREAELRRTAGMPQGQGAMALYFPLANVRGIEIEAFAVALARVTLWMGHKLAVEELGLAEATLPLTDLSGIRQGDALRLAWPRADAIVGNPPFHGSQHLRRELGDGYVEWLKDAFGIGVKDYCVYWFRKAHDHLPPGGRAGLVGTNSVSQNRARSGSLDHIAAHGGVITDAVSKQPWPGAAVVNVSIVNWVREPAIPPPTFVLDGEEVATIATSLRPGRGPQDAARLAANRGRCFQGPIPVGAGFVLAPEEARALLARPEAAYADVVRPYLIGDDVADDPAQGPRRWIIDFAMRTLEEAMAYPRALEVARATVKPLRERNNRAAYRERWWRFAEPRPGMRAALSGLSRYIAGNRIGKRLLFAWQEPSTCPSDLTNVFAFESDYAMGVLASRVHGAWARMHSTLREDIRYTPTSSFETFPWPPAPSSDQSAAVAGACAAMMARRGAICAEQQIGLTALYNQVDEGAWADLAALHLRLDEAVARAYGWPAATAQDAKNTNALLLALNGEIAAGRTQYAPFAGLGA